MIWNTRRHILGTVVAAMFYVAADAQELEPVRQEAIDAVVKLPKRVPPARDFPVEQVLEVTAFGAVPDDGKDDLAGLRAAMAEAQKLGKPVKVVLPKGTYDLHPPANPDTDLIYRASRGCLGFYKASSIILDGQGSTVVIHAPTLGFLTLLACKDMVVRNFTVEWATPPFAQGFVRGVNREEGWFEFEQTPGFLSLDDPIWQKKNTKHYAQIRWGMLKDRRVPGRMKAGVPNVFFTKRWEKAAENRYRMYLEQPGQLQHFEVGDPYVHVDRNGGGLFGFTQCERVVIEGITNYTSPGLDYGGALSSDVGLFNCRVLLKPGYWHTSNADAMHFSQFRVGPWVEGCTFEGMADDGANLYAHPVNVAEVVSDTEFLIAPVAGWQEGDMILGFEPKEGRVLGRARVVSAAMNRETMKIRLVLDAPIPGMQVSKPRDKTATYFLNMDLSSSNFVFRDNTFRNLRRFGILMQTHDGVVEGNTFEGVSASALVVRNSPGWPEGFATGNILLRNNLIRDCGLDNYAGGFNGADISVAVQRLNNRNGISRAISGVAIVGNTIENTAHRAISVASATNVLIAGNTIRCEDAGARMHDPGRPIVPIRVRDVDRVTVRGNLVQEVRSRTATDLLVEGKCTAVNVKGNSVTKRE